MKRLFLSLVTFTAAFSLAGLRDADACTPEHRPSTFEITLALGTTAPKDGALPFIVGADVDPSYRVDVTDAKGNPVEVVVEDAIVLHTKVLRAKSGELPTGKLHIVFTYRRKGTLEPSSGESIDVTTKADVDITAEKMADFEPVLYDVRVTPATIPDETSPKVTCHRDVERQIGECGAT